VAQAWDAAKDKLDKALAVKLEALAAEQAGRTHVAKAAVEVAAEVAQEVAGGAGQPSLAEIKAREKARVEKMSKARSTAREFLLYRVSFGAIIILPFRPPPTPLTHTHTYIYAHNISPSILLYQTRGLGSFKLVSPPLASMGSQ
jgi:hypothetical protein